MTQNWYPDLEFLEFLLFIEKGSTDGIKVDGKNPVEAAREGTIGGRRFYNNLYNSPRFQVSFQNWKDMIKSFGGEELPLLGKKI